MRAPILLVCALGLSGWLSSCGPSYFLAMQPSQANGPSVNGRPTSLISRPDDSVEVRLGFIRYEPTELVFEVEINNSSSHPVRIAPETFYYLPLYSEAPDTTALTAATPLPGRVAALDPEVCLKVLSARLDKQARKAQGGWLELLSSTVNLAEDISSIGKKETEQQIAERQDRHASDEVFFAEQREQHAQKADMLYDQKYNLESVALRNIALPPRQYVTGQVYFPRTDGARQLRVVVFFDERPVVFHFTQKSEPYQYQPPAVAAQAQ